MPSNHLILYCPLYLLLSFFPSIRVFSIFSKESVLWIRWPKYGASASVLPMNIHGWLLLGSPCSPRDSQESSSAPQFKGIKSPVLHLLYGPTSHPYMTTGKNITLTRRIFVSKVMSLLFNTLSRFVIAFLLRSNNLLISWLQSPSTVYVTIRSHKLFFFLCWRYFQRAIPDPPKKKPWPKSDSLTLLFMGT